MTKRLADDGEWYTQSGFKKFYPRDWSERWALGPREVQRRFGADGKLRGAKHFYDLNKEQGGYKWSKDSKTLWDTAVIGVRHLADDGKWYPEKTFFDLYKGKDPQTRWNAAPPDDEERVGPDGEDHTASWFFRKNQDAGGPVWTKRSKPGWDSPLPGERISTSSDGETRLADNGKWYTSEQFEEFYPGREDRWNKAPSCDDRRMGKSGRPHDAEYFFKLNKKQGGSAWTLNSKPGWDEARAC